jgi:hypothetical protein
MLDVPTTVILADIQTKLIFITKRKGMNNKLKLMDIYSYVMDEFVVDPSLNPDFNMEEFKSLKTFKQRVEYCNKSLNRLSSGSSRVVYRLDSNKVLKLAKNNRGIEQNSSEGDHMSDKYYEGIVTKVYEIDDNDEWVVSELAGKMTPNLFKELTGISLSKLDWYLQIKWGESEHTRERHYLVYMTPEELQQINESNLVKHLVSLMKDHNLLPGDLGRISSWGVVNREGKKRAVLVDYGHSQ